MGWEPACPPYVWKSLYAGVKDLLGGAHERKGAPDSRPPDKHVYSPGIHGSALAHAAVLLLEPSDSEAISHSPSGELFRSSSQRGGGGGLAALL